MQYSSMLVVLAAIVTLPPRFAFSQGAADYPAKTVRVIASASPGGGADLTARMFAQKLSENLKQQFVVDNRPGAGDTIGTGLTAKSPPDGYTLMLAAPSFTIAAALYQNSPSTRSRISRRFRCRRKPLCCWLCIQRCPSNRPRN